MRVFRLARLAARERYVIGLLRGPDPAVATDELAVLFDSLRAAIARFGFRAGPRDSGYSTMHELCVLGVLAGLQREQADLTIGLDRSVRPIALGCARELAGRGVHLHHATLFRLTGYAEACRELSIRVATVRHSPVRRRAISLPSPGTLQARALRFVQSRGATSTRELVDYGVSRQVVSLMHKRGVLDRVRTGIYQASPETMRG